MSRETADDDPPRTPDDEPFNPWRGYPEGVPAPPNHGAADVAGWLRHNGADDLAELLDDESQWPATETLMVRS